MVHLRIEDRGTESTGANFTDRIFHLMIARDRLVEIAFCRLKLPQMHLALGESHFGVGDQTQHLSGLGESQSFFRVLYLGLGVVSGAGELTGRKLSPWVVRRLGQATQLGQRALSRGRIAGVQVGADHLKAILEHQGAQRHQLVPAIGRVFGVIAVDLNRGLDLYAQFRRRRRGSACRLFRRFEGFLTVAKRGPRLRKIQVGRRVLGRLCHGFQKLIAGAR